MQVGLAGEAGGGCVISLDSKKLQSVSGVGEPEPTKIYVGPSGK